ncbi:hypothetical protein DXB00_05400 [Butyricicoccus sp. OF10-2]|nr:hypothetical protein DXB00_05400 [Butyricicoccus sp. OF10-2]
MLYFYSTRFFANVQPLFRGFYLADRCHLAERSTVMTVCGITAEYNPFHTGHLHHIAETRRSLGENAVIVCVMSGNFVQRGDFAVLDKYARAEMAVRCGADLVVELPLAAALSSAEASPRVRCRRCTHSGAARCRSARRLRMRICFYRRQNS